MSKIYKILLPVIAISAFILGVYSLHLQGQRKIRLDQIIELSTQINNAYRDTISNVDSLQNLIIQQQFERQSYTSNLELISDWSIFSITILFGIFFVVGYGFFHKEIADYNKNSLEQYERIDKRYLHFENEFKDLKYDVHISIAKLNRLDAWQTRSEMLKGDRENIPNIIFRFFEGMEHKLKAINIRPENTKPADLADIKESVVLINFIMNGLSSSDKKIFVNYCTDEHIEDYNSILKSVSFITTNGDQAIKNECYKFIHLLTEILKESKA